MDHPPPKEPRGPVSLRIKFRSATLEQFIDRYGVDVSRGGIFIRTREPLGVGTQLRFDFQLQDAAPLLGGEGTVVWIRENDPARAGVTPGMGVRFDKLTPASQPVLEKILSEKGRREQAGAPAKTGPAGGMAVRRPSSTFSALDPAAARAQATSPGAQPRAAAPATGSGPLRAANASASLPPRAAAPATTAPTGAAPRVPAPSMGSGPIGAAPRTAAPTTGSGAISTTARTAERPVPGGLPTLESSGAFGRPRATTGMSAQRPAPAPHALFEKPTADDIDRALSVLTEVDGPGPAPPDLSSRLRRPTDAQPTVLEATPDVGDASKAPHRRPTDAQPMVLEAMPDVGDAPSRRTGTRPLFSSPDVDVSDPRRSTVPVIPIGDEAATADADDEDDATSAWIGSGPTRVGGSGPVPAPDAAAPPAAVEPPRPATAPGPSLSLDGPPPLAATAGGAAAAPTSMKPSLAGGKPKKRSSAPMFLLLVVLAGGAGGGYFYYTSHVQPAGGTTATAGAPAPAEGAPTAASAATAAGAAPASTNAAPDATAAAAAAGEAANPTPPGPEGKPSEAKPSEAKAAEATPTTGAATPGSLRARPAGEAPTEPPTPSKDEAAEAKPAEAKPPESKPAEHPHHGRRHAASAGASAEAASAVADVTPTAPSEAPAGDSAAKEPPKSASSSTLKITTSPGGAEVIIDGNSVGKTPYLGGDVDPGLPHSITLKKDGFEDHEHMISGSDWPRAHNGARTLKLNVKLRPSGGAAARPAGDNPEPPSEQTPGLGTTPASPKRE
jgi:uncharacterized protein (TIGR02266 family)